MGPNTKIDMTNEEILGSLFENGLIDLNPGRIFKTSPGALPHNFDFDRIEGMLLGLAIGDSMGNTSEGMAPGRRKGLYGEIRDYLPNRFAGNKPVGLPSDDTQLAFWTLEQIIENGGFNPEVLAAKITSRKIFGLGSTVKNFIRNYKSGKPWYRCGPKSAGNGALMRIAPMVVPHLRSATSAMWADAALSAMLTHNDSGSIAACIAFIRMIWESLRLEQPPGPEWWLKTYLETARELEIDRSYVPRCSTFKDFKGSISDFIEAHLARAFESGLSTLDACNKWCSGAFLLETVPCVLFILMKHGADPEEAIVRAANDTVDNDTIAAIVGAAVGALHGKRKLPRRFVSGLPGRTAEGDDGRIFELISEAGRNYWDISREQEAGPKTPAIAES